MIGFANAPQWEQNQGQFTPDVLFATRDGAISMAITPGGMKFAGVHEVISVTFEASHPRQCKPSSPRVSEANYLALRPAVTGVPAYSSVTCSGIYDGIDWTVHDADGAIEHDWNLASSADPTSIVLQVQGAKVDLTPAGELHFRAGGLRIVWKAPRSFQYIDGQRREVKTEYSLDGRRISLRVGDNRSDLPLVIDPVIDFTHVVNGGRDDYGLQVAVDGAGNTYVAGLTNSPDFLITPGAPASTPVPNKLQVFVRKLSGDGTVIYSTYLGFGQYYSKHPIGMGIDSAGSVYIATNVFSWDGALPATSLEPEGGGVVGVFKLSPAGDSVIYGARLFAPLSYVESVALAVDASGGAYVGSGNNRLYVAKLDTAGSSVVYRYEAQVSGSFGTLTDLALGPDNSLYAAGLSSGGGLTVTPGVVYPTVREQQNPHGYLIRLKPDGSGPVFATYIGANDVDSLFGLAVDSSGAAYVGGQTDNGIAAGPLAGTPLGGLNPLIASGGTSSGFVTKIAAEGDRAMFNVLLPDMIVGAVAVDGAGSVYAGGYPSGPAGFIADRWVIAKINEAGTELRYYLEIPANVALGGTGPVLGMTADGSGSLYLAGSAANLQAPSVVIPSYRMAPNAFFFKLNPNPPQSDIRLEGVNDVPSDQPLLTTLRFRVHNQGPGMAEGVRFTSSTRVVGCSVSGDGTCQFKENGMVALFDSILPGQSRTVELQFSPAVSLTATGALSSLSSDLQLANNTATVTAKSEYVPIGIASTWSGRAVAATFSVLGLTPFNGIYYARPNTPVQVLMNSPQIPAPFPGTTIPGTLVFARWSDGSVENPRTFTVSSPMPVSGVFNVDSRMSFKPSAVVNAGSYASPGVAPGEFVTLGGFNLAFTGSLQVVDGRVTTQLGNTTVLFDDVPAPLVYTSAQQINAIVPYSVAGKTSTTITVRTGNATTSATVPVVPADPSLFTSNASGTGQAAALNQDGSINSPANPARIGEVVVLYGTGEGLVNPIPADGAVIGGAPPSPELPVTVSIGGLPAVVAYAGAAPGLAAGVIQINTVIPAGITPSHHVPISWSAGEFVSQAGVTIAVEASPSPTSAFPVEPDGSPLATISVLPTRIPADTGAKVVTVLGSGFRDGMVVLWNGQPRSTKFIDASRLQGTLTGPDLEGAQMGSVTVGEASGSTRISKAAPVLVYLPISNQDLVYDSARHRIYVAATTEASRGPSIAIVNPEIGRVERWIPLSANSSRLAISGDNRFLYVAMGNLVRRFDVQTWVADLDIPLGVDLYGPREVMSMVVLPGANDALAVSFKRAASPSYGGTGIFDKATLRPVLLPDHTGPESLTVGPDSNTFYGINGYAGDFYTIRATAQGATVASLIPGLAGAAGVPVFAGGLVYTGWGTALDPMMGHVVRSFSHAGMVLPLPDLNRVVILGGTPPAGYGLSTPQALTLSDAITGAPLWSLVLPVEASGARGGMVRWGDSGIAFREGQYNDAPAPGIFLIRLDLAP